MIYGCACALKFIKKYCVWMLEAAAILGCRLSNEPWKPPKNENKLLAEGTVIGQICICKLTYRLQKYESLSLKSLEAEFLYIRGTELE